MAMKTVLWGAAATVAVVIGAPVLAPDLMPAMADGLRHVVCRMDSVHCFSLRGRELLRQQEKLRVARQKLDLGERAAAENDERLAVELRGTEAAAEELARLEIARRAQPGQDHVVFRDRAYSHSAGQIVEQIALLAEEHRLRQQSRIANQEDRRALTQARSTLILSAGSVSNALARLEVEKAKQGAAREVEGARMLMEELQTVGRSADVALSAVPASPVRSVPELLDQSRRARPTSDQPAVFDFEGFLARGGLAAKTSGLAPNPAPGP